MTVRSWHIAALLGALTTLLALSALPVAAQNIQYFGKNRLEFAAAGANALPEATGTGIVDYKGGKEPESRWRATFRFTGLAAGASYTVVMQGRFGSADTTEATAFTSLCSFAADGEGKGGCFWYFRGLERLDVVQLRAGDEQGTAVLEARRDGARGAITTSPNRFSPGGEIPDRRRSRNGNGAN